MTEEIIITGDSLAVIDQSLMALGAGMSANARRDAKTTFQFASRVASKAHDRDGEAEAWFNKFLEVMRTCGWVVGKHSYERDYDHTSSLTLGPVVFKVARAAGQALLGGALGEAMTKLTEKALGAIGEITEAQDIFKYNLKGKPTAVTGVGTCLETPDGEMVMLVSAFSASPGENDLDTLAFEWKSSSKNRYSASVVLTFNEVVYTDELRATIEQKMIDKGIQAAREFEI